jgi:hypothetical protein
MGATVSIDKDKVKRLINILMRSPALDATDVKKPARGGLI